MAVYSRKLKSGTRWYIGYRDPGGRWVRKGSWPTKREATIVLAQIRANIAAGKYGNLPSTKKRVDPREIIDRYFEYATGSQTSMTIYQDKSRLKPLIEYLQARRINNVFNLNPGILQEFQSEYLKTRSRKSWNNLLGLLKTILNYAIEWEIIDFNPVARIRPLKIDKTFHFFTAEEIAIIIAAAPEPIKTAIVVLVNTGMRRSELWNLRWRDVDLKNRRIHIKPHEGFSPKDRELRSIPMTDSLHQHMSKMEKRGVYVCRPYESIHTIRKGFVRILKKLELSGTLHDLRHTFASHLAMSGVPVPAIAELLGHSSIKTTMIYSHLLPETHTAAVKKLPF
jgi:integrase